jgi:hypothetical protein
VSTVNLQALERPTTSLEARRSAVAELAAALRDLNEASVATEVSAELLSVVARQARALVPILATKSRGPAEIPTVEGAGSGRGTYNPAAGVGNRSPRPCQ